MTDQAETELLLHLRRATKSENGRLGKRLQSLWSGYGAIYRFHPEEEAPPLIAKYVSPPNERRHPRGWSGDTGHARKLRSYDVEMAFYQSECGRCDERSRIAKPVHLEKMGDAWLFVLEDLDHAGFGGRRSSLSSGEMKACLGWLAHFHALHLQVAAQGLWQPGTYWHLATRPDELRAMKDKRIRNAASAIDEALNASIYQTWVHGDAKVANFCFSKSGTVAAVDFQYVGSGVGVKDVAYFLSSCLDERECLREADRWVDEYFSLLEAALVELRPDVRARGVVDDWRRLYSFAWADFVRFLLGWASEHYKLHGYSMQQTEIALRELSL